MTQFMFPPLAGVTISDADETALPISFFHIVVIVEPDPESYMPVAEDLEKLGEVIYDLYARFDVDANPNNPVVKPDANPEDTQETIYLWLRNFDEDANYFKSLAETAYASVSFNVFDPEDTGHLEYYLTGLKMSHPGWRIAVIGAMYEDEVIRIANFLQNFGFPTTVLTRYCLSNQVFVNLDNLLEHAQWVRNAGRKEGEPFRSWLDDWLEEHGGALDDEDDLEEE
jgi:hypothetical protein